MKFDLLDKAICLAAQTLEKKLKKDNVDKKSITDLTLFYSPNAKQEKHGWVICVHPSRLETYVNMELNHNSFPLKTVFVAETNKRILQKFRQALGI